MSDAFKPRYCFGSKCMNSKLLSTVAVAALLVIAGCAGTTQSSTTTTTESPTTTTQAPTTTTTGEPVQYVAPGVSEAGVVDGFRLGEAHVDTLRLNTYTVVQTETTTAADGTVLSSTETVAKHGDSATAGTKTVDGEQTAAFYHDGDAGTLKTGNETAALATPTDAWTQSLGAWKEDIYAVVSASDVTVERFETESGKVRYRLTAENPTKLVDVPNDAENANVEIVVSGIGLVNEYTISYDTTVDGESATYTKTVAFTNVDGTSVDQPDWHDAE